MSGTMRFPRFPRLSFTRPLGFLVLACFAASALAQGVPRSDVADPRHAASAPAFLPLPRSLQLRSGAYEPEGAVALDLAGHAALEPLALWMAGLLSEASGQEVSLDREDAGRADIVLDLVSTEDMLARFTGAGLPRPAQVGEAYALRIEPEGVTVSASGEAGLAWGLVSLWQAVSSRPLGSEWPGMDVLDAPEFAWRGLMLDSSRHMQSVDYILGLLDAMALHKLNVFHWHLSDDQAWRLEIKAWPELARVGGYRVPAGQAPLDDIDPATGEPRRYGGYYTQEDVRRVVAYAAERQITVVPEIDVPGHATAAIAAYPWLGVDDHGIEDVPASWGIYHNVFNLEEKTFGLLEDVMDEIVALFPGEYIHLGGDEVVTEQWERSPRVRERMEELGIEELQGVQNLFVERLQAHLEPAGKRIIGWDEILESDLPPQAAVMSWRGVQGAIEAAAKGHQTVLSPAPTLYFDHVQNELPNAPPGRGGVITVRTVYDFDPLPAELTGNREFVLGVQANLWTEHIRTEERAAWMTWPRAVALAEVGWTAPELREWEGFSTRLESHLPRLSSLGITHAGDTQAVTGAAPALALDPLRREDRELELCQSAIELVLEDDAPLDGEREAFRVDILKPCWIWRDADLSGIGAVRARVGQLPFNFEIGEAINSAEILPPRSPEGEMTVRLDDCSGPLIAELPLAPAVNNPAATTLAPASLADVVAGRSQGDLCIQFTRPTLEPFWALDWIELVPAQ